MIDTSYDFSEMKYIDEKLNIASSNLFTTSFTSHTVFDDFLSILEKEIVNGDEVIRNISALQNYD